LHSLDASSKLSAHLFWFIIFLNPKLAVLASQVVGLPYNNRACAYINTAAMGG
jgi:hypothetical protein